jgi:hypothetical protein
MVIFLHAIHHLSVSGGGDFFLTRCVFPFPISNHFLTITYSGVTNKIWCFLLHSPNFCSPVHRPYGAARPWLHLDYYVFMIYKPFDYTKKETSKIFNF